MILHNLVAKQIELIVSERAICFFAGKHDTQNRAGNDQQTRCYYTGSLFAAFKNRIDKIAFLSRNRK